MKRRTFLKKIGQATAAVSLPLFLSDCKNEINERPNILWIVVEDRYFTAD